MPNAESHPWGWKRSHRAQAEAIVAKVQRGDMHLTPDITNASSPWHRSDRYAVSPTGSLIRPRPERTWTEYPPIARVRFDPPVAIIRCVERR